MMKTNLKTFNKNIKKHRNFLKKNGYLVITNILNKKDLENMEKLILKTAKIYINFNKRKISGLDDPYFNKELIKLRKKSKKKLKDKDIFICKKFYKNPIPTSKMWRWISNNKSFDFF